MSHSYRIGFDPEKWPSCAPAYPKRFEAGQKLSNKCRKKFSVPRLSTARKSPPPFLAEGSIGFKRDYAVIKNSFLTVLLRRSAKPVPKKPRSSIIQVAGSGTAGEMVIVPPSAP